MNAKVSLYSAVGDVMTHYAVDVDAAVLVRRETVQLPANAQYAWPHPSKKCLYVATSNRGPGLKADFNHVSAFGIDSATGALTPHGAPQPLRDRAVHICADADGRYLLSGYNLPVSGITVHRL